MSIPDQMDVVDKGFDKAGDITADALAQLKKMAAAMDTEKEILKKYAEVTVDAQSEKMKQVASDAMAKSKEKISAQSEKMIQVASDAMEKSKEMVSAQSEKMKQVASDAMAKSKEKISAQSEKMIQVASDAMEKSKEMVSAQSEKMKQVASDAMAKGTEMVKVAEEAQVKAFEMYSQMMKSGNLATGKANESLQKAMAYYEKVKGDNGEMKLDSAQMKKMWEGVDPDAKAMLMSGADTKVMAKYTELLKAGGIAPGEELETIRSAVKLFESMKSKLGPDGLQLDAKTAEAVWSQVPEDTRLKVVAQATDVRTTIERLYTKAVDIADKALDWIDHTCFPEEEYDAKVAEAKAKDSDDEDDAKADAKADVEPDVAVVVKGGVSLEAEGSHAAGWFGLTQRVFARGEKAVKFGKRVKQRVERFSKEAALRKARWSAFTFISKIALYSFLGFFGLILVAGLGVALLPLLFVIEILALLAMLTSGVALCLPA